LRRRLGAGAHGRQLDAIGDAVGRGVTLTRHLLAFSRRQALQPRTLDLHELMPNLCELLAHSLRGNIRLACSVAPETWPIKADPTELELAILNIAVNARDAMPNGGTLTITARNATVADMLSLSGAMLGEYVLVALHDTGEGIPPSILNRVFEPFFTTKETGKGTGLGLSQVYGFTRQTGGTVTLQSPPGRGTTVTLWLPRSTEAVAAAEAPAPAADDGGAGHVLVVEDDHSVALVLRELLEQLGYDVTLADSGAGALERLAAARFDLVLTDVVMLGPVNGLELARTLRSRQPDLPVVLMTGYAAEIARIAAEGFTVLNKPFDVDDARADHRAQDTRAQRRRDVASRGQPPRSLSLAAPGGGAARSVLRAVAPVVAAPREGLQRARDHRHGLALRDAQRDGHRDRQHAAQHLARGATTASRAGTGSDSASARACGACCARPAPRRSPAPRRQPTGPATRPWHARAPARPSRCSTARARTPGAPRAGRGRAAPAS
jgi:CheY-like chemotaxis protein